MGYYLYYSDYCYYQLYFRYNYYRIFFQIILLYLYSVITIKVKIPLQNFHLRSNFQFFQRNLKIFLALHSPNLISYLEFVIILQLVGAFLIRIENNQLNYPIEWVIIFNYYLYIQIFSLILNSVHFLNIISSYLSTIIIIINYLYSANHATF